MNIEEKLESCLHIAKDVISDSQERLDSFWRMSNEQRDDYLQRIMNSIRSGGCVDVDKKEE